MNPEVAAMIDEIRLDRSHGAGWLSRQAVAALKLAVEKSETATATSDSFLAELSEVAQELVATRPSMTSITNAVAHFLSKLHSQAQAQEEMLSYRELAFSVADELIAELAQAAFTAAANGAEAIAEEDRVLTCSYSSAVCEAFRIAANKGRNFEVLVAESKFGNRAYGKATAEQLEQYSIPVEVIPDDAILDGARRAEKALVGADSILNDGSLVNGAPTHELALAAREHNIPFYVVCETAKFSIRSDVELEAGFEQVPSHLITGIVTEKGLLGPEEVPGLAAGMRERIEFNLPGYSMGK